MTHISALKDGIQTYIMRRLDLMQFLGYLPKYHVTDLGIVPPIAVAIINSPTSHDIFFKGIKSAICGAAPLEKSLQAVLRRQLPPNVPFTQVWGMTEMSGLGFMTPYPEDDETGSVGRLIPGMEAKFVLLITLVTTFTKFYARLIDDDGKDISAYNVRGEICLRGPIVIGGYFENDAANRESFDQDGWFKTGDIGYCAKGTEKWYIVDRKKELIKVRGFQVAPPEIEAVLVSHPYIVDAAVIGVTLPSSDGEHPRAYVVKSTVPNAVALSESDVKIFVASRLAKYKTLSGGVEFVDAIPKNASGKILKKTLRERARRETGRKAQL